MSDDMVYNPSEANARIYRLLRNFFAYTSKEFVYDTVEFGGFFHKVYSEYHLFYHQFFRDLYFLQRSSGYHSPDLTQGIQDLKSGGVLMRKFPAGHPDIFTVLMSPNSKDKIKEKLASENPALALQLEDLASKFDKKFALHK